MVGRFAVDGVDHHLLWLDFFDSFKPWQHIFIARIVHILPIHGSFHEHCLHNDMPIESLECFDHLFNIIRIQRAIDELYIFQIDSVELEDIVIYKHESFADIGTRRQRGITQHTHLCFRTKTIAQRDGILYDTQKVGVGGRFSVTRKGKYIGHLSFHVHLLQTKFERTLHLLPCRAFGVSNAIFIEATFAVDTIERANLPIAWHQIDA